MRIHGWRSCQQHGGLGNQYHVPAAAVAFRFPFAILSILTDGADGIIRQTLQGTVAQGELPENEKKGENSKGENPMDFCEANG